MNEEKTYNDFMNMPRVDHFVSDELYMLTCHAHNQFELLFVQQGTITVENSTDTVEISAPAVIIHNRFTLHRATCTGGCEYRRCVIYFNEDTVRQFPAISDAASFISAANMTVIRIDADMADVLTCYIRRCEKFAANTAVKNHIVALILCELAEYRNEFNTYRSVSPKRYINDILEYITAHFTEPLTIESLASRYFISRAKLVNDFRRSTGTTVKGYITLIRLNNARTCLHQGMSVAKAAAACGYKSESNFIAAFGKLFGVNPGEYLKVAESRHSAMKFHHVGEE